MFLEGVGLHTCSSTDCSSKSVQAVATIAMDSQQAQTSAHLLLEGTSAEQPVQTHQTLSAAPASTGSSLKRLQNETVAEMRLREKRCMDQGMCLRGCMRKEEHLCAGHIHDCALCGANSRFCQHHKVHGIFCSEGCALLGTREARRGTGGKRPNLELVLNE